MIRRSLLLLVCVVSSLEATHSFLRIRPPFWSSWPERIACNRYQFDDPYDVLNRSTFTSCLLGGSSLNPDDITRYFLPFDRTNLLAGELGSTSAQNQNADVIASYFGVLTGSVPQPGVNITDTLAEETFQSRLFFEPRTKFAGIGLCYHYHFSKDLYKGWWLELSTPILWVTNTMGLEEDIITQGGPNGDDPIPIPPNSENIYVQNMTEAFNQASWSFGKINGSQTKVGLGDIEFKIGYTIFTSHCLYWASYWGLYIPTGFLPTNEFVFEPVIGYGQHWGIFMGGQYGYKFWQGATAHMSVEIETVGKFFFPNEQNRLFDPNTSQWGRYLWVYNGTGGSTTPANANAPSPGVNFFSRLAKIQPGTTRDLNMAWVYRNGPWSAEVGYHYFAAEAESATLVNTHLPETGVAGIWTSSDDFSGGGITRNFSQINNYEGIRNDSIQDPDSFIAMTANKLNLASGVTPPVITHTNYLTIGYKFCYLSIPATFSLGGSLEYGKSAQDVEKIMFYGRYFIEF